MCGAWERGRAILNEMVCSMRGCQEHLSVFARDVGGGSRHAAPVSYERRWVGVLRLMNVVAWVVPSQSLYSGCDDAVAATRGPALFRVVTRHWLLPLTTCSRVPPPSGLGIFLLRIAR